MTTAEIHDWCASQRIRVSEGSFLRIDGGEKLSLLTHLNRPPSELIGLAAPLLPIWEGAPAFEGALLWIRARGIWGNYSEQMGDMLLRQLRAANGAIDSIEEQPGAWFDASEATKAHGFFMLPLMFGWDAYLIPANQEYFVFVSHDGMLATVARTPSLHEELRARLTAWDAQPDNWYFKQAD